MASRGKDNRFQRFQLMFTWLRGSQAYGEADITAGQGLRPGMCSAAPSPARLHLLKVPPLPSNPTSSVYDPGTFQVQTFTAPGMPSILG